MALMLRWTGRILVVLGVAGLLLCAAFLWYFTQWKAERTRSLEMASSLIQTPAGPIEYATSGEGQPVMVLHGAPGGYDQGLLLAKILGLDGFRTIAPSRPGFLRTPLDTGVTFEDQADACIALADALKIDRFPVVAYSTGASVAMALAQEYPDRVTGLILISPVTRQYKRPFGGPLDDRLLGDQILVHATGDMGAWLIERFVATSPDEATRTLLEMNTDLTGDSLESAARSVADDSLLDLTRTLSPLSLRETGTRSDYTLLEAQEPFPSNPPVPTMAIFGKSHRLKQWTDPTVLEGAIVSILPDAGELVWLSPDWDVTSNEIVDFLRAPANFPRAPTGIPN